MLTAASEHYKGLKFSGSCKKDLFSSLLSNRVIIKICISDHLITTLSCLWNVNVICYSHACDRPFFHWTQWKTVLGWMWQQEPKLTGRTGLQVKLFFIQTTARWCFLQWLRFLCFMQLSSLSLVDSFELYHAPSSYKSLTAHSHHVRMAKYGGSVVTALTAKERNYKPPIVGLGQLISDATGWVGSICHWKLTTPKGLWITGKRGIMLCISGGPTLLCRRGCACWELLVSSKQHAHAMGLTTTGCSPWTIPLSAEKYFDCFGPG